MYSWKDILVLQLKKNWSLSQLLVPASTQPNPILLSKPKVTTSKKKKKKSQRPYNLCIQKYHLIPSHVDSRYSLIQILVASHIHTECTFQTTSKIIFQKCESGQAWHSPWKHSSAMGFKKKNPTCHINYVKPPWCVPTPSLPLHH